MIVNAPSSTSAVRTHSGATWRRRVARGAARDQPAEAPSLALCSGSGSSERAHPPGRDISRRRAFPATPGDFPTTGSAAFPSAAWELPCWRLSALPAPRQCLRQLAARRRDASRQSKGRQRADQSEGPVPLSRHFPRPFREAGRRRRIAQGNSGSRPNRIRFQRRRGLSLLPSGKRAHQRQWKIKPDGNRSRIVENNPFHLGRAPRTAATWPKGRTVYLFTYHIGVNRLVSPPAMSAI